MLRLHSCINIRKRAWVNVFDTSAVCSHRLMLLVCIKTCETTGDYFKVKMANACSIGIITDTKTSKTLNSSSIASSAVVSKSNKKGEHNILHLELLPSSQDRQANESLYKIKLTLVSSSQVSKIYKKQVLNPDSQRQEVYTRFVYYNKVTSYRAVTAMDLKRITASMSMDSSFTWLLRTNHIDGG